MTSRLQTLFAAFCMVSMGLFFAGCDSGGGGGGNGDTNQPPTASFEVSVSEDTVDFTNTSSDPDGEIASSEWEFGDGETSTENSPTHVYDENGTYEVSLTVTDDADSTDTTTMDVSLDLTTFEIVIENVSAPAPILKSGVFNTPVGASEPGSIGPGSAYEFSFTAGPNEVPGSGMVLSFATMFIDSNDMYYAFAPGGVPLYDENGNPIGSEQAASLTDQVNMYDAGTEEDQQPGAGSNQPQQGGPESGPDDANSVVLVEDTDDDGRLEDGDFEYPAVSDVINVSVTSEPAQTGGFRFTVRIENVSTTADGVSGTVLSPGTFAAHFDQVPNGPDVTYPSHEPGSDVNGTGIEDIAEDGNPTVHAQTLASITGVTVPLSPGGYAAHSSDLQLFQEGAPADAVVPGVEGIAEDGDPTTLVSNLQGNAAITDGGAFARPDGASENGPLVPTPPDAENNRYTVTVDAAQGDRLSIGTMYIQSNDVFYAFQPEGLPLFTNSGDPISGDVTDQLRLYDAGTEVDEEPGVGLNQAPRQGTESDVGEAENADVVRIQNTDDDPFLDDDGFNYAPILDGDGNPTIIKVTVTPQ